MKDEHILRSFDDALRNLSTTVREMGNQVLQMVEVAGRRFCERDARHADEVVRADLAVDRLQEEANAAVLELLSRYTPVAGDLRRVLAMEHVAANLERAGDHAKNIAKRTIASSGAPVSDNATELLARLHRVVVDALGDALRALEERDPSLADHVRRNDDQVDRIYDDLFHTVIADLRSTEDQALGGVQALFVGKSLERIGDHATNIAEEVRFLAKGVSPSATRS